MSLFTKTFSFLFFLFALTLPNISLAECDSFLYPVQVNRDVLFYNCTRGEALRFDSLNNIASLKKTVSLGGFIHALAWSPDGTKSFILSENISAAVQTLPFFSEQRPYGSLNWWLYDFSTETATLLDQKILFIGWHNNTTAIYNWNNEEISTSTVGDTLSIPHEKVINIAKDEQATPTNLPPVTMGSITLFPSGNGFYLISGSTPKYYSTPNEITNIITDPFEQRYFILQAKNQIFSFDTKETALSPLASNLPITDISFFKKEVLALLDVNGNVYTFDTSSKTENTSPINKHPDVSHIFSRGIDGEFLYTINDTLYSSITSKETSLIPVNQTASPQIQTPSESPTSSPTNMTILLSIGGALFVIIFLLVYMLIRKYFKK